MKLATFEKDGREGWGIVIDLKKLSIGNVANPSSSTEEQNIPWIVEPEKAESLIVQYASAGTSAYALKPPVFLEDRPWPADLASFLALEDRGMKALIRLNRFLCRFIEQSDVARISLAGYPLDSVVVKAPIPRPRLYWGLVQNCPTFTRNQPNRIHANFFPQGHQRPQGTVVGCGQPVVKQEGEMPCGFNVEFAAVIGKKGRYIPPEKAMDHVAGFTAVTDISSSGVDNLIRAEGLEARGKNADWFLDATGSWGGKKSDTHCPMGPYLVTKDEVGNPYDLLVYTRQNGFLRDRAHTGALVLGFERVIQWYSSFATLYPGDVIHLATMGVDGLRCDDAGEYGPDGYLESEIEKVGSLRNPVVALEKEDWRSQSDEGRTLHAAPAVRDLIKSKTTSIAQPSDWSCDKARHFWTIYGNYDRVEEREGIPRISFPRYLNGPASSLAAHPAEVKIPPGATTLQMCIELALVIGRITNDISPEEAAHHILGFTPLISICDQSFDEAVIEPASSQERNIPAVYGRWADGFNIVLPVPVPLDLKTTEQLPMSLSLDGIGEIVGNTDEYVVAARDALPKLTRYSTFFPGDVVTLGRISERIPVTRSQWEDGVNGTGCIEGIGEVRFSLAPDAIGGKT